MRMLVILTIEVSTKAIGEVCIQRMHRELTNPSAAGVDLEVLTPFATPAGPNSQPASGDIDEANSALRLPINRQARA